MGKSATAAHHGQDTGLCCASVLAAPLDASDAIELAQGIQCPSRSHFGCEY